MMNMFKQLELSVATLSMDLTLERPGKFLQSNTFSPLHVMSRAEDGGIEIFVTCASFNSTSSKFNIHLSAKYNTIDMNITPYTYLTYHTVPNAPAPIHLRSS